MVPVRRLHRRSQGHRQQGESLRHRSRQQRRSRHDRRHQHRIPASRRLPRRHLRKTHLPGSLVGERKRHSHEIPPIHLHGPRTREIRLIQGARHRGPPRRRLGADMEHRIRLHGKRLAHMGIHRAGAGRNQCQRTLELQHQHRRRLQPLHQRRQHQPIQRHQKLLPQHHRIPQK